MSRQSIDPKDIRKGDLIRAEYRDDEANEWRADYNGDEKGQRLIVDPPTFYLLDRPRVLLYPAGSHLWLTRKFYPWENGERITLERDWYEGDEDGVTTVGYPGRMRVTVDAVTDVLPTTAVPTAALDALRDHIETYERTGTFRVSKVRDFLTAVDKANEATR